MANMPKRLTPSPIELTTSSCVVFRISGGSRLFFFVKHNISDIERIMIRDNDDEHSLNSLEDDKDRYQDEEDAIRKPG